jgi:hypothetical protein
MSKTSFRKLHYVNNPEFLEHMKKHVALVKECKEQNKNPPQVSDYIGECIYSIANKLANKPNFMNYPFRDEMISDGIENSLQYINNFNPSKSSNPFAYFTQIIYYAFVRRIQREKKHLYAKYRLIEESLIHDISENEYLHATKYGSDQADLNMHEFVENFEKSREKKKSKAKLASAKKKNLDFDDIFEQLAHETDFVEEIEIDENSDQEK